MLVNLTTTHFNLQDTFLEIDIQQLTRAFAEYLYV